MPNPAKSALQVPENALWLPRRRVFIGRNVSEYPLISGLARIEKRCAICGSTTSIDLHHLFYRQNLEDVQTSDLRWLCRRCHNRAHELINSKVLKFKPGASHHAMFAATKSLVNQSFHKVRIRIDNDCPMAKKIDALRTGSGGWSKESLAKLGVTWPPPKGWRKDLIRKSMAENLKCGH